MRPKIYNKSMVVSTGALYVLNLLKKYEYEAYIVGGACRDFFLGYEPKDFDICTNATPKQIQEISKRENIKLVETGLQHGTLTFCVMQENIEVTTYRVDGEYVGHRKPTEVHFVIDVVQDLKRRDFTINSILYDPQIGFLDYFDGVKDLQDNVIRCVGNPEDRFEEDALRILRAIRFASKLGFNIEINTQQAIESKSYLLKHISKERIQMELNQILLSGYKGIQQISKNYLLFCNYVFGAYVFDYIQEGKGIPFLIADISTNLALLFYLFDISTIKQVLQSLKYDNKTIKTVVGIIKAKEDYMCNYKIWNNRYDYLKIVRFLLRDYGEEVVSKLFDVIKIMYSLPDYFVDSIKYIHDNHICCYLNQLKINGMDLLELGFEGKEIKKLLTLCLDFVVLEEVENTKEALIELVSEYLY